ncbi:glucosamine-6-phosphate deaminase [Leuconostoc fallax]|uniref:glucosamine-6-phosphate deaminase n=1 Tax=Leuconostoc fallax TaxID=1251 RepID=UPI002091A226|nr:glucosamine-6-phosphate deaminase [Leuconostoc fallax]MCO6184002.1 glucosamine-6-phosphate deaminase [Leuconostoc fallax]
MKIIKVKNQIEGAQIGFDMFKQALENDAKVFGLATGSTPIKLYEVLRNSDLDFSNSISINLDEYLGLSGDDPQSYRYFMTQQLFNQKPFQHSYVPDGVKTDTALAAKEYDQIIDKHPIDLQLLGIGRNGHIGFNEPGTSFESKTHVVDLQPSTIEANARFFEKPEDVPTQAISMGIASVMSAKHILLMAYGESKAEAISKMINGPVTEEMPASILQKHNSVTIIVDEAAANKLN